MSKSFVEKDPHPLCHLTLGVFVPGLHKGATSQHCVLIHSPCSPSCSTSKTTPVPTARPATPTSRRPTSSSSPPAPTRPRVTPTWPPPPLTPSPSTSKSCARAQEILARRQPQPPSHPRPRPAFEWSTCKYLQISVHHQPKSQKKELCWCGSVWFNPRSFGSVFVCCLECFDCAFAYGSISSTWTVFGTRRFTSPR